MITQTDLGVRVDTFRDIEKVVSDMRIGETKRVLVPEGPPGYSPDTDKITFDLMEKGYLVTILQPDSQNMSGYIEVTRRYD